MKSSLESSNTLFNRGLSLIQKIFRRLEQEGRCGLIVYYPFGYPDIESSIKLINELSKIADLVEIGIPFTDPTADGPTIQAAYEQALKKEASLPVFLRLLDRLNLHAPAVLMSYANPVFKFDLELLSKRLLAAGISGFIIPDLPAEEKTHLLAGRTDRLPVVLLASPTDSLKRAAYIARVSEGFLYLVTALGVTGIRDSFEERIFEMAKKVRVEIGLPVAAGFGISKPEQVARFAPYFDAVIVGSAVIKKVQEQDNFRSGLISVKRFLKELKEAGQKV